MYIYTHSLSGRPDSSETAAELNLDHFEIGFRQGCYGSINLFGSWSGIPVSETPCTIAVISARDGEDEGEGQG